MEPMIEINEISEKHMKLIRLELKHLKESIGLIHNRIENLHYALGHRTVLTEDDIDDLEYIIYDLYTFPTIKMNRLEYCGNNEILNCNFNRLKLILKEIKGHE